MNTTTRNILIIVGIALALTLFSTTLGPVAAIIMLLLRIGILAGIVYFGYTLWRQNRYSIGLMPRDRQIALYALAGFMILLVLGSFVFATSLALSILFFALLGGAGFGIWWLVQDSRRYY